MFFLLVQIYSLFMCFLFAVSQLDICSSVLIDGFFVVCSLVSDSVIVIDDSTILIDTGVVFIDGGAIESCFMAAF